MEQHKLCAICNQPFVSKRSNHICCSHECNDKLQYQKRKEKTACPGCGQPMSPRASKCEKCSPRKERMKILWQEGKLKPNTGESHPTWKGGRYVQKSTGYAFVLRPDHPRANPKGYIREHILVWEQAHGKPLPDGWIIHHLNGIRDDNRSINLAALPNKKHQLLLQAMGKRIQELEAALNHQAQLL